MGRQVKIDCPRLPIPFTYTGNWIRRGGASAADPRSVRGGQVSGITGGGGGLRKIIRGDDRAGEKKPRLYCRQFKLIRNIIISDI